MVLAQDFSDNYSKSPTKPLRLIQFLETNGYSKFFDFESQWKPFGPEDFCLAHEAEYVADFFAGKSPKSTTNGLGWSPQFAQSVRYTNASLYAAVQSSVLNPQTISFSPTSGFHHAHPAGGYGYCTFSGQVIASLKLWRDKHLRGAWIDLDGHYGNSIEDSRVFAPDLIEAVAPGNNINPEGKGLDYLANLRNELAQLRERVLAGGVDYLCFCHGADSHMDDDLGDQCSTEQWLEASRLVYTFVRDVSQERGAPLPLSLSLFGGYRAQNYDAVLALHAADLLVCLQVLGGVEGLEPTAVPHLP